MATPADDKVDLLVCDAVRRNPDGKFDLAGFFPTGEIQVGAAAQLPVHLNLTFIFVLRDGEGRFRPIFCIHDPLGAELHRYAVPEFEKLPGVGYVMMLPVRLIPFARSGNYAISLEIDGQHYRRTVRIFQ